MERFFNKVVRTFVLVSAMATSLQVCLAIENNGVKNMASQSRLANPQSTPSAVGYYISTGNDQFYPIEKYVVRGELGLNKLANVPHVPVNQTSDIDKIELIINIDNVIDLQRLAPRFYAQSAAIIHPDYVKVLDVAAEQISTHLFRVRLANIEQGDIITVVDNNSVYAISLGEITENVIQTLSTIDWPSYKITDSLEQALKSFPDNQPMKDLLKIKLEDKGNDKLVKISKDIDAKLDKFNSIDKHGSKLVHAKDVVHEIGYYEAVAQELGHAVEQRIVDMKSEMQAFIDTPEVVTLPTLDTSLVANSISYYQTSSYSGTSVGSGNILVSVVAVGETDLLLRFNGVGNEFDGKVIRARKEITNDSLNTFIAKTTEVTGENWNLFLYENDGWSASFAAYPPAIETKVDLFAVKESDVTAPDSPEAMINDYAAPVGPVSKPEPAQSKDLSW
jgi:hypothetical protein